MDTLSGAHAVLPEVFAGDYKISHHPWHLFVCGISFAVTIRLIPALAAASIIVAAVGAILVLLDQTAIKPCCQKV
jgi:hypothetical protein